MNSEELFGFKYKWLEPSMANEEMYQDGDLFVRIAQDIARITVEALPNGYNLNKLKAIKPSQQWQVKCWGGSKSKDDIEALLSDAADLLEDAIVERNRQHLNEAWEKLSCARALANKATGKDSNGLPPDGDVAAALGKKGGNSKSAKMLKIKQALCKSVSTFLRERDYWDESKTRPLIKDAYVLIYEAMKRGFEQNSKWLYVDEDSWSKYGLGKPAIDACISASKRRYQRSKQY